MVKLGLVGILQKKGLLLHLLFIIIPVFLYINASALYGTFAGPIQEKILIYLIFYAFVLASLKVGLPAREKFGTPVTFAIMFIITALVMTTLPLIASIAGAFEGLKLAVGLGLAHGFVFTYIEEIVFRYGIGDVVLGGSHVAGIIQAVIFGVFHFAVSGGSIFIIVWLSLMGMVWWVIYKRFGILGASGSHLAYNLAAFGVLGMII